MKKSTITKFIDRSKEIINEEVDNEKKNTTVVFEGVKIKDGDKIMEITEDTKKKQEELEIERELGLNDKQDNGQDDHKDDFSFDNGEEEVEVVSTSTIASDVVIVGNISAKGNLDFHGKIEGDIECHQNLNVGGEVKGNIKASYISLKCKKIVGDIDCENLCEVLGDTAIQGNVTADNLIVEGSVNGTINAKNKVTLCASAVLEGDCITSMLKIEEGALVKGNIQMSVGTTTKK